MVEELQTSQEPQEPMEPVVDIPLATTDSDAAVSASPSALETSPPEASPSLEASIDQPVSSVESVVPEAVPAPIAEPVSAELPEEAPVVASALETEVPEKVQAVEPVVEDAPPPKSEVPEPVIESALPEVAAVPVASSEEQGAADTQEKVVHEARPVPPKSRRTAITVGAVAVVSLAVAVGVFLVQRQSAGEAADKPGNAAAGTAPAQVVQEEKAAPVTPEASASAPAKVETTPPPEPPPPAPAAAPAATATAPQVAEKEPEKPSAKASETTAPKKAAKVETARSDEEKGKPVNKERPASAKKSNTPSGDGYNYSLAPHSEDDKRRAEEQLARIRNLRQQSAGSDSK